jgi:hypothetical protein
MKIPVGKSVTLRGKTYKAGDELPAWAPKEVKENVEGKRAKSPKPTSGNKTPLKP